MRRWMLVFAVVGMGCGQSPPNGDQAPKGPLDGSLRGQIEIATRTAPVELLEPTTIVFEKDQLQAGESAAETIEIKNVDLHNPLEVTVWLEYQAPEGADEGDEPALFLQGVGPNAALDGDRWVKTVLPVADGDKLLIQVGFRPPKDARPRAATLHIESDTRFEAEQHLTLKFATAAGAPVASLSPVLLDFSTVQLGDSKALVANLSNTGTDVLTVSEILFHAEETFSLQFDGQAYKPMVPLAFDPPIQVKPNQVLPLAIRFTPTSGEPAMGSIVLYTNDPAYPTGLALSLTGNNSGAHLAINPKTLQFGAKHVGTKAVLPLELSSIGTSDLEITGLELQEGHPDYALVLPSGMSLPTADKPWIVAVNETIAMSVQFVPAAESPLSEDGQFIPSLDYVHITSNTFEGHTLAPVSGIGANASCPVAVGVIQEGEQVVPQTTLHLFGDHSFSPFGPISAWKWSIKQPGGSATTFIPSSTFQNPTIQLNAAGEYQLGLNVWDTQGTKSCMEWNAQVLVIPDEAIHVELLWNTPGDPDQTDQGPEAGSDLDLHFVDTQFATGPDVDNDGQPDGYFDQPYDCFWFNAHPNWSSFDPFIDDDPGLDRDDTDGAGPENLNLNIPRNTVYKIGVHVWSDHQYGPSLATLRVYIYGNLVFEVADVKLQNLDMWDVATIAWPSGKVSATQTTGGMLKITPNYQNPFFFQP